MTVKELREKLAEYPDSATVLVAINDGYAYDYCAPPQLIENWQRTNEQIGIEDRNRQVVILEPEE